MTTLATLRAAHPALFYPQTWLAGEAFLHTTGLDQLSPPKGIRRPGHIPTPGDPDLPLAATLASAYVRTPGASIWRFFLWCADVDRHGNPIYVGGIGHDDVPGFQIHRHLKPDLRWGTPRW